MRTRVLVLGLLFAPAVAQAEEAPLSNLFYNVLAHGTEPTFTTKTTIPLGPVSVHGGLRNQSVVSVVAGSEPGTHVLTISARVTGFTGAGASAGAYSAEAAASAGGAVRYQVTVSETQRAAIADGGPIPSPFDPASIAPGMSMTVDLTMITGVSGRVAAPVYGVPVVGSLGMVNGYGRFVTLRRVDAGRLEVMTGESAFVQTSPRLGVGIGKANLSFGGDDRLTQRSGDRWTIDLASFNGQETFRQLLAGTLPPEAPDRVTVFSNANDVSVGATLRGHDFSWRLTSIDRGTFRVVERTDGSAVIEWELAEGTLQKRIEIPADGSTPTALYTWTAAVPRGMTAADFLEPFTGRPGTGLRAMAVEGAETIVFTFTEAELAAMAALVNARDGALAQLREGNVLVLAHDAERVMSAFRTLYVRNGERPLPWHADFGVVVPTAHRWSADLGGSNVDRTEETRPGVEQQLVDAQREPDPLLGPGEPGGIGGGVTR